MKLNQLLMTFIFALSALLPAYSEARVSEGHKKAQKYMKALPSKGQRGPASAGKHKVKKSGKIAKNDSSSKRKPASKKKSKKSKSHSKKAKHKSKNHSG